jgi:tetratricopeptide (TPR) repeat protein
MIVVDTGSTDDTVAVARDAGARVEHFAWIDDFAAARNHAFDQARGEWVMWLDADDRVPPAAQAAFLAAKDELMTDALDVLVSPYRSSFDERGALLSSQHRERVVRRAAGLRWEGAIHEVIPYRYDRAVYRDDLIVEHRPEPSKREHKSTRNLTILERRMTEGTPDARDLFYWANELRDAGRLPEAIDAYHQYLEVSDVDWEKYTAYLSLSGCSAAVGNTDTAIRYATRAMLLDPSRAEAFMALGRVEFDAGRWGRAVPLYAAAAAARRPAEGFVREPAYTWESWDFLSVCLINAGRHSEGIRASLKSLELGNPDRERINANIAWSLGELGK